MKIIEAQNNSSLRSKNQSQHGRVDRAKVLMIVAGFLAIILPPSVASESPDESLVAMSCLRIPWRRSPPHWGL